MKDSELDAAFERVWGELEKHWDEQDSPDYKKALLQLTRIAEAGSVEAAEALAEILALYGPNRDPEAAYRWYYIALGQQGYSVNFEDRNGAPPHYCGPIGDFRNESMVSELVSELGFTRVQELDKEAAAWLRNPGITG